MKRFIYLLLTSLFIFSIVIFDTNNVIYAKNYEVEGYSYGDLDTLQSKINEYQTLMTAAHDMANAARALGYSESHSVIQLAKEEYKTYSIEKNGYEYIYNDLTTRWENKRQEYPEVTKVWEYLKNAGYSDYVCAGIIGNIMTEVGSNTLAIQPLLQTKEYYGICQWSSYYPDVWGLSLEEQCKFLITTIENEFSVFGKLYRGGITYEEFEVMTDCRVVALCFAKVYERCGSDGYNARQDNAVTAYNYFVS